jgi:hypothetical protein
VDEAEVSMVAKRLAFLWVVLGLVLMGSVVAGEVLVEADQVIASPEAATEPAAEPVSLLSEVDDVAENGLPPCKYPGDCPPPKPVECVIQVETFGTVIGIDDSQGFPINFFDPNYRVSVTGCDVAGIVFSLDGQFELARGTGSELEVEGLAGVCPNDPYAYRIDVLGADGSVIDVEQLLLGDEEGACSATPD